MTSEEHGELVIAMSELLWEDLEFFHTGISVSEPYRFRGVGNYLPEFKPIEFNTYAEGLRELRRIYILGMAEKYPLYNTKLGKVLLNRSFYDK